MHHQLWLAERKCLVGRDDDDDYYDRWYDGPWYRGYPGYGWGGYPSYGDGRTIIVYPQSRDSSGEPEPVAQLPR